MAKIIVTLLFFCVFISFTHGVDPQSGHELEGRHRHHHHHHGPDCSAIPSRFTNCYSALNKPYTSLAFANCCQVLNLITKCKFEFFVPADRSIARSFKMSCRKHYRPSPLAPIMPPKPYPPTHKKPSPVPQSPSIPPPTTKRPLPMPQPISPSPTPEQPFPIPQPHPISPPTPEIQSPIPQLPSDPPPTPEQPSPKPQQPSIPQPTPKQPLPIPQPISPSPTPEQPSTISPSPTPDIPSPIPQPPSMPPPTPDPQPPSIPRTPEKPTPMSQPPSMPPSPMPPTPPVDTNHPLWPQDCLYEYVIYDSCDPLPGTTNSGVKNLEKQLFSSWGVSVTQSEEYFHDAAGCCMGVAIFSNCGDPSGFKRDWNNNFEKYYYSLMSGCQ